MFDSFSILSGTLCFIHTEPNNDWLIEKEAHLKGTGVIMIISPSSRRTPQEVFDRFAPSGADYGFSKTIVPVTLARYEGENLVSRSQAKRLLTRFDQFQEIVLDFTGVQTVGQAFADEVFRVFARDHPHVALHPINMSDQVTKMVARALGNRMGDESNAAR